MCIRTSALLQEFADSSQPGLIVQHRAAAAVERKGIEKLEHEAHQAALRPSHLCGRLMRVVGVELRGNAVSEGRRRLAGVEDRAGGTERGRRGVPQHLQLRRRPGGAKAWIRHRGDVWGETVDWGAGIE